MSTIISAIKKKDPTFLLNKFVFLPTQPSPAFLAQTLSITGAESTNTLPFIFPIFLFIPSSYFSLMLMPIFSIIAILVLLLTVSLYLSFSEVREIARDVGPQGALLIPGFNPYLPIVYGWIAIFIGFICC